MVKGSKAKSSKKDKAAVEASGSADVNVFDNPEAALVEGSAEHLAVMEGNAVQGPDETEVLDCPEAQQMLARAPELVKVADTVYWELAGVLGNISNKKWYKLAPYNCSTFEAYLQQYCHMERRKGYYFVQIHNYFNANLRTLLMDKPDEYRAALEAAKKIGWSKAAKLASEQVISKDNVQEVMDKAQTCTLRDLDLVCKSYFAAEHEEDKQEREDNNDVKTVRLSFQCSLAQKNDIEEAIEKAVVISQKEEISKSSALAWACRDFVATNVAATGKDVGLAETLSKFERLLGVSLIAVDEKLGKIVYGIDTVQKLAGAMPATTVDAPAAEAVQ